MLLRRRRDLTASRSAIFSNENSRFGSRFDTHGPSVHSRRNCRLDQPDASLLAELLFPLFVRGPFVSALPVDVGLVTKTAGKDVGISCGSG